MKQRTIGLTLTLLAGAGLALAANPQHRVVRHTTKSHLTVTHTRVRSHATRTVLRRVVVNGHVHYVRRTLVYRPAEHFTASSFAENLTLGDVTGGEDATVRAAAVEALGDMNGTVLAIDPSNGRILAMVNQKLALSAGAEPCSTIKVAVALAALKEGLGQGGHAGESGRTLFAGPDACAGEEREPVLRGAGTLDGIRAREALCE